MLERFCGRPASELGRHEVEEFLLHLIRRRKLSPSTHNVYAGALRFLYGVVLERPDVMVRVPRRKQPMRLPLVLSPPEIERLLAAIIPIGSQRIRRDLRARTASGPGGGRIRASRACSIARTEASSTPQRHRLRVTSDARQPVGRSATLSLYFSSLSARG
jgi:integrase